MSKGNSNPQNKTKHIHISPRIHAQILSIKPDKFKTGPFIEDIMVWGIEAYKKHISENNASL